MAVALVVQLIMEGAAGGPPEAAAAAHGEAAHGEAALREQVGSKPGAAVPPTGAGPSSRPAQEVPPFSGMPGPSKQAEERPAKEVPLLLCDTAWMMISLSVGAPEQARGTR